MRVSCQKLSARSKTHFQRCAAEVSTRALGHTEEQPRATTHERHTRRIILEAFRGFSGYWLAWDHRRPPIIQYYTYTILFPHANTAKFLPSMYSICPKPKAVAASWSHFILWSWCPSLNVTVVWRCHKIKLKKISLGKKFSSILVLFIKVFSVLWLPPTSKGYARLIGSVNCP